MLLLWCRVPACNPLVPTNNRQGTQEKKNHADETNMRRYALYAERSQIPPLRRVLTTPALKERHHAAAVDQSTPSLLVPVPPSPVTDLRMLPPIPLGLLLLWGPRPTSLHWQSAWLEYCGLFFFGL